MSCIYPKQAILITHFPRSLNFAAAATIAAAAAAAAAAAVAAV